MLLMAGAAIAEQRRYEKDGELRRAANYREWIYLSSGLGMQYSSDQAGTGFTNVFAEPTAYHAFLKTGKWPEGTMLAMEVRQSQTEGSINKAGRFQTALNAVEVTVKGSKRFPKDSWDYFVFNGNAKTAKAIGQPGGCNACPQQERGCGEHVRAVLSHAARSGSRKGYSKARPLEDSIRSIPGHADAYRNRFRYSR
jgi:Cytochrome P460